MEPRGCNGWQPVESDRGEKPQNKRKPLPWAATGCREERMVRRGSTVRVRQRASQKRCKSALLLFRDLAITPSCSGMEHFLEHSALGAPANTSRFRRFCASDAGLGQPSRISLERGPSWCVQGSTRKVCPDESLLARISEPPDLRTTRRPCNGRGADCVGGG
jgi:hypothetical protein